MPRGGGKVLELLERSIGKKFHFRCLDGVPFVLHVVYTKR
jgi:hypothetical protein